MPPFAICCALVWGSSFTTGDTGVPPLARVIVAETTLSVCAESSDPEPESSEDVFPSEDTPPAPATAPGEREWLTIAPPSCARAMPSFCLPK